MRHYYDCRIFKPGEAGMNFSHSTKREAIRQCKRLLKIAPTPGMVAIVRARPRGVIGMVKTWPRLPIVWDSRVNL